MHWKNACYKAALVWMWFHYRLLVDRISRVTNWLPLSCSTAGVPLNAQGDSPVCYTMTGNGCIMVVVTGRGIVSELVLRVIRVIWFLVMTRFSRTNLRSTVKIFSKFYHKFFTMLRIITRRFQQTTIYHFRACRTCTIYVKRF